MVDRNESLHAIFIKNKKALAVVRRFLWALLNSFMWEYSLQNVHSRGHFYQPSYFAYFGVRDRIFPAGKWGRLMTSRTTSWKPCHLANYERVAES